MPIESGVPQGTILGPIFFLFYINDIVQIYNKCQYLIYADDCSVLIDGINMKEIVPKATAFCQLLYLWCKRNRLNLNESKTKCVLFRPLGTAEIATGFITLGP